MQRVLANRVTNPEKRTTLIEFANENSSKLVYNEEYGLIIECPDKNLKAMKKKIAELSD